MKKWKRHVKSRWKLGSAEELPIVEVLWFDAQAKAVDWESTVKNSPLRVVSLGYLVEQDDEALTIVSLITENSVGHGITIPKGCVHQVRFLGSFNPVGVTND